MAVDRNNRCTFRQHFVNTVSRFAKYISEIATQFWKCFTLFANQF